MSQKDFPKCEDCGNTAMLGEPLCSSCAERRLLIDEAGLAVNSAREHLAGVITNLGISQQLVQAIDALIEAHIARGATH